MYKEIIDKQLEKWPTIRAIPRQVSSLQQHMVLFSISEQRVVQLSPGNNEHNRRIKLLESFLSEVCSRYNIKDNVNLIATVGDAYSEPLPLPLFVPSYDTSKQAGRLQLPNFYFMDNCMERIFKHLKDNVEFELKKPVCIFRGASTGSLTYSENRRIQYCKVASPLVDCKISWICQLAKADHDRVIAERLCSDPMSRQEQLAYKYQLTISGNTTSWDRLYWQMISNSVVLLDESPHQEYYYPLMKPYVHYIPCTPHTIVKRIADLELHPNHALKVIKAQKQFAKTHLNFETMQSYTAELLRAYISKVQ